MRTFDLNSPGWDPAPTATSPFNTEYEQLPEEGDDQERAAREWLSAAPQ